MKKRKKKERENLKRNSVHIRLTDQEYTYLQTISNGMPISTTIRNLIFSHVSRSE